MRDSAERLLFPEFDGQKPNGAERPVYGALNVSASEIGPAPVYGTVVLVLKDEVKRRATFMANDSFYSPKISVTQERIQSFYKLLDGSCTPELGAQLRDPCSERGAKLASFLDRLSREKDVDISIFQNIDPSMIPDEEHDPIASLMIDTFGDRQATRSHTASYDSLETLFNGLSILNATMLAGAAQEFHDKGAGHFRLSNNYIEAQVHGGIIPSRDIAEIRIDPGAYRTKDLEAVRKRVEGFGKATGVKVTILGKRAMQMNDSKVGKC